MKEWNTLRWYSGERRRSDKILQPHEDLPVTEGRDLKDGEPQRVEGRPEEENEDHDHLRSDQKIGKPAILERCFFSSSVMDVQHPPLFSACAKGGTGIGRSLASEMKLHLYIDANSFRISLLFLTASSSPCFEVFLPATTFSISRLDVVPDRDEISKADSLAVGGGLSAGDLGKGGPHVGVLLEMVRRLESLQRRVADRQISRLRMPPGLLFGLAQKFEELGHALYSSGLCPFITQRLAPPMMEFPCGYPAIRGRIPVPHSNLAVLVKRPDERRRGKADGCLTVDDRLIAFASRPE